MSVTLTIGNSAEVRDCYFSDEDHGADSQDSDLDMGGGAKFVRSVWLCGDEDSTITMIAGALVDESPWFKIAGDLLMTGSRARIRDSRMSLFGDIVMSGDSTAIIDTYIAVVQEGED